MFFLGEPATHMGVSIVLAIRNAIADGKKHVLKDTNDKWFSIGIRNLFKH